MKFALGIVLLCALIGVGLLAPQFLGASRLSDHRATQAADGDDILNRPIRTTTQTTIRGQSPSSAQRLPKGNPLREGDAANMTVNNPVRGHSILPAATTVAAEPALAAPDDFFPTIPLDDAPFDAAPPSNTPMLPAALPQEESFPTALPSENALRQEPAPPVQTAAPAVLPELAPALPEAVPEPPVQETLSSADPFGGSAEAVIPIQETPTQPENVKPPVKSNAIPPIASNRSTMSDMPPAVELPKQPTAAVPTGQLGKPNLEGTGTPGMSVLEGAQTPHLTIEKVLPEEIIVDQPTIIKTVIKNVGKSAARNIIVADRVPQGAKLISTSPEALPDQNGELRWSLGNLDMSEQFVIEMHILPYREGEIGSVATVNFSAESSARIAVTRPMLKVDVKFPQEIHRGQTANLEITISNPGTATASGIVLEEHVPDGLFHKVGKVIANDLVGSLKPREAKRLVLPLTCTGAGNLVNRVVVKANGGLEVEEKTTIRALSPDLKLEIQGTKQRFLERQSSFQLVVSNTGTAAAQNVDLVVTLPAAMKFVSTNQSGVYDSKTHTVHWALEELPISETGTIELTVLPQQIGDHAFSFMGTGQNNLKAEDVKTITIDGLPAISFEVVGDSNLVELGKELTYEVRVSNKGTKAAENVRVHANLPAGLSFVKAEGPRYQEREGVVQFEPLLQLAAKTEKVYRIKARCQTEGDHRVSVQVISDDLRTPITKEESTRVFQ